MSSPFRKAMHYLGLGPDEEYDDYGYEDGPVAPRSVPRPQTAVRPEPQAPVAHDPDLRVLRSEPGYPEPVVEEPAISALRPVAAGTPAQPTMPAEESGAVRPIPVSTAKPQVVVPVDFNDAQQLGDRFKASQPVIVNLQGADLDLARRVIDFASGLCYGLGGQMERVASQVYLLTPSDVEVSDEDRRRITERGLDRRR